MTSSASQRFSVDDVTTVITSTGRALLTDALQTVLEQTGFTSRPCVIVSSSGTDASVIKSMIEPFNLELEIQHLHQDELLSGNAARNRAIAEVKTKLVAMLDDDDIWHPNKLEVQVEIANDLRSQGHHDFLIATEHSWAWEELSVDFPSSEYFEIQDLLSYLFIRDFKHMRFQTFQASTFLFSRDSFPTVVCEEIAPMHSDWSFGSDFCSAGFKVVKAEEKLVFYRTQHLDRETLLPDFQPLFEWADKFLVTGGQSKNLQATYFITVPLAIYCDRPTSANDLKAILKLIPISGVRPFTALHAIRSLAKLTGRKLLRR